MSRAEGPLRGQLRLPSRHPDHERGSFAVELVVLTPVLVLFVVVVIALGRVELGQESVTAGARAAAAAAAVAPSPEQAEVAAGAAASAALGSDPVCVDPSVALATTRFTPGGETRVNVTCHVNISDLGVPGLAGQATVVAGQSVPIDPYRAVGP